MSEAISKEYYSLSKIKYLLKKELRSINSKLIDLELKKLTVINNDANHISSLDDFDKDKEVQILNITPNNGISKSIAIIKTKDINIDRKLNVFSANLDKNLDYMAIDIQKRFNMLNKEYFNLHFSPIYLELYKDSNKKLTNLRKRIDVLDIEVSHEKISYKLINIISSRKQNLVKDINKTVDKVVLSIEPLELLDKHAILNKYLKSIDSRLSSIKSEVLKCYSFKSNEYLTKNTQRKEEVYIPVTNINSDNMISKTLNGHAIITKALKDGETILESMYEEKINFKIMEIGTKEMVIDKINSVIGKIEKDKNDLETYVDTLIQKELEDNKTYDPFEDLL